MTGHAGGWYTHEGRGKPAGRRVPAAGTGGAAHRRLSPPAPPGQAVAVIGQSDGWCTHGGGGELASRLPLAAGPAGSAGTARGGRPSPKRGGAKGRGDETYHDWGNHESGRSEKVLARDWGGGEGTEPPRGRAAGSGIITPQGDSEPE